jgi:TetR/AcrR family transcriptional repressor of mexCD-oprJ operon
MPDPAARSPQRADALRNIEKIIQAAIECLSRDPDATLGEIAQAAGVGRVTLYGHFPSREVLIEAAVVRALSNGNRVLDSVDLEGPPLEALRTLIETSWKLTAQVGTVVDAALAVLPPGRLHELHATQERRVNDLIDRGQREGVFRDDLPAAWLASTMHYVMKGAAADVSAGRLDQDAAGHLIADVIVGAYSPPRR